MKINVIEKINYGSKGEWFWKCLDETKKEYTSFPKDWNKDWKENSWVEVDQSQIGSYVNKKNKTCWNINEPTEKVKQNEESMDAMRKIYALLKTVDGKLDRLLETPEQKEFRQDVETFMTPGTINLNVNDTEPTMEDYKHIPF